MTTPERITLYTNGFCPFTLQVRLTAAYKKVDYELEQVSFDPKPEWFLKASPEGTVPLMKIGDSETYLTSSADMLNYLEEKYPTPSVYPSSVPREDVHKWVAFVRTVYIPAFMKVMMGTAPPVQAEFRPKLKEAYTKLQAHLAARDVEGPYFFGAEYSLVDILLTPFVARRPLHKFFREFDGVDPKATELNAYLDALVNKEEHAKIAYPLDELKTRMKSQIPWLPPLILGRLEHDSQRTHMKASLDKVALAVAAADNSVIATFHLKSLKEQYASLLAIIHYHSEFEDNQLYVRFLQDHPDSEVITASKHQHEHELSHLNDISALIDVALKDITNENLTAVQKAMTEQFAVLEAHLVYEEKNILPIMQQLPKADHVPIFTQIYDAHKHFYDKHIAFILKGMSPAQRAQYVVNFAVVLEKTKPGEWARVVHNVHHGIDEAEWADLKERVSQLSNVEVQKGAHIVVEAHEEVTENTTEEAPENSGEVVENSDEVVESSAAAVTPKKLKGLRRFFSKFRRNDTKA